MKRLLAILLIAVAGCTRFENLEPESRLAVKDIAVTKSETAASTRARYDEATRELFWTDGDGYFFYTFGASVALSDVTVGTLGSASHITEIIPVTYDLANDNTVVIGSVGTDVGTVTSVAKTSVTIAGGIPAVQDGTVESSYVNLGTANLQSEDEAALRSCQAYLSFNLLNLNVGGRDTRFFTVEGRDNETICGNTTYTLSSGTGVPEGDGKKIVVNVTAAAQTDYYVAIAPRTYEEGLRVTLYDAGTVNSSTGEITGGHVNAYIDTYAGVSVSAGKILALGDLTSHKTVPGTGLAVHPSDAHIVKLSDFVQTKKLWIKCTPADMTDIEFEYSQDGIIVAERGPDEEYDAGDGLGPRKYMTVLVTPVCPDKTSATDISTCVLTIKDKYPASETSTYTTCTVNVGMFIDPGLPSGTLWAATNVKGDGSTDSPLGFETTLDAYGDMYPWGWTKPRPEDGYGYPNQWKAAQWKANSAWAADAPEFTTQTIDATHYKVWLTGGRYNTTNGDARMKAEDDVCTKISPLFHIPTSADFEELRTNTENLSCVNVNNHMYFIRRSKVKFFEDVDVYFRLAGWHTVDNLISSRDVEGRYWSSDFAETGSTATIDASTIYCADFNALGWTTQYCGGGHCWVDCLAGDGGYYRQMVWHSCSVKAVWTPTH